MTVITIVILAMNNKILEIKEYAKNNHVPIIKDEGLDFLLQQISKYEIKRVLEIGCAIGYSAINMALSGSAITTIERDEKMYLEALKNIKEFNLTDKINIIYGDALEVSNQISGSYDLLFIDAAKAQYEKFFNLYTPFLKKGGIVICDNLEFHDLVKQEDLSMYKRSLRSLIKKLRLFREFLANNKDYTTTFYSIGDGMSVSVKN